MKIQLYQRTMFFSSVLFALISAFIVVTKNPEKAEMTTLIILYVCIFALFFSLTSLLLSVLNKRDLKPELIAIKVKSFTRQSLLFATFVVLVFFLGSIHLLTWWDGLLLAFSLVLFELYFKSTRRRMN